MSKKEQPIHWAALLSWQEHTGEKCPVPENAKVVYRTLYYGDNGRKLAMYMRPSPLR